MITVPELDATSTLLDTDLVMLTHDGGTSEKITGENLIKMIDQLVAARFEADKPMYTAVDSLLDHNTMRVTPKNITNYYQDGSIYRRLTGNYKTGSSGERYELFEDLHVGDYFEMSRAISAPNQDSQYAITGTKWVTIAGIDTLMSNGDQSSGVTYHHLVLVPGKGIDAGEKNHFGRKRMNATNTTQGGYAGSEMNTATIGQVVSVGSTAEGATINQQLYAEFGSHLKTTRELLTATTTSGSTTTEAVNTNGYNRFGIPTGCSQNRAWFDCQAVLMSEVEVYGCDIWSSSGFDDGNACVQLPLFRNKRAMNNRMSYWWLKAVASAAYFCYVSSGGYANYNSAGSTHAAVRPRFVIGA